MSKFDRVMELRKLFATRRRPVSMGEIRHALECSDLTARRMLHYLRDFLDAPLDTIVSATAGCTPAS